MTEDVKVLCGSCSRKHDTVEDAENCSCDTEVHIYFRDTLLRFRSDLADIEQWWKQSNEEKAKENLLDLAERVEDAADFHFGDVETWKNRDKAGTNGDNPEE